MFDFAEQLDTLRAENLFRTRRVVEEFNNPYLQIDGKPFLSFASNDYLGLANHPKIISAVIESAQRFGVGAGAAHLVSGHSSAHHQAEQALAAFVGFPSALLFSTGYMANLGVVTALTDRESAIFADKLNHASLNDAAILSRADLQRYRHNDLQDLSNRLAKSSSKKKLIVTDGVFSMDGDIASVPQLIELCERFDALLLIDDAHGFGVLGQGKGVLAHFCAQSSRVIYMGTLGKAAGVFGAFVAAENKMIEFLIQKARTYIYTTATPPLLATAVSASIEIIRDEEWRRARLTSLIGLLKSELSDLSWQLLPSDTPIQPLLIGDNELTLKISRALYESGIWVPAIRPPTVAKGTARLRISLSAAHEAKHIEQLAIAIKKLT